MKKIDDLNDAPARFTRYGGTRHWAVTLRGALLAVVLYKKGARAICDALNEAMEQIRAISVDMKR
jgi:hypothetical protein